MPVLTSHDNVWIEFDGWEYQESLAQELERAVEDLQHNLSALLYDEEEAGDFETPSGMPYCGCSTCEAREILCLLVPILAAASEAGRIRRPEGHLPGAEMPTKEDDSE
jgi:hypothetical protein